MATVPAIIVDVVIIIIIVIVWNRGSSSGVDIDIVGRQGSREVARGIKTGKDEGRSGVSNKISHEMFLFPLHSYLFTLSIEKDNSDWLPSSSSSE